MGIYSEYLDKGLSFPELTAERKKQLKLISELRGDRDFWFMPQILIKERMRYL